MAWQRWPLLVWPPPRLNVYPPDSVARKLMNTKRVELILQTQWCCRFRRSWIIQFPYGCASHYLIMRKECEAPWLSFEGQLAKIFDIISHAEFIRSVVNAHNLVFSTLYTYGATKPTNRLLFHQYNSIISNNVMKSHECFGVKILRNA